MWTSVVLLMQLFAAPPVASSPAVVAERMLEAADKHAAGRLISVLEGGYDLDALASSVRVHLRALTGAG